MQVDSIADRTENFGRVQMDRTWKEIEVKNQDLPELIKHLVELDEEIKKRLDDLKKLMKRNGDLLDNQQETDYIQ